VRSPVGPANDFGIKKAERHAMCRAITTHEVVTGKSVVENLEFADNPSRSIRQACSSGRRHALKLGPAWLMLAGNRPNRSHAQRLYAIRSQNFPLDKFPEIVRSVGIWYASSFAIEPGPTHLPRKEDISAICKHEHEWHRGIAGLNAAFKHEILPHPGLFENSAKALHYLRRHFPTYVWCFPKQIVSRHPELCIDIITPLSVNVECMIVPGEARLSHVSDY
jgi:hypothetical protein